MGWFAWLAQKFSSLLKQFWAPFVLSLIGLPNANGTSPANRAESYEREQCNTEGGERLGQAGIMLAIEAVTENDQKAITIATAVNVALTIDSTYQCFSAIVGHSPVESLPLRSIT
ncbi:hypothetical protein X771_15185 [Mesorhizobium sp. LSJC277A00]|nr:hypothetical protein X771_15185 [Mesorhizobium sp. LSJC277A00]ESZ50849.1 hypothetical protein X730_05570 [Mesorhizobium sp. L103C565B0]